MAAFFAFSQDRFRLSRAIDPATSQGFYSAPIHGQIAQQRGTASRQANGDCFLRLSGTDDRVAIPNDEKKS